jgi:hypothetical protein
MALKYFCVLPHPNLLLAGEGWDEAKRPMLIQMGIPQEISKNLSLKPQCFFEK